MLISGPLILMELMYFRQHDIYVQLDRTVEMNKACNANTDPLHEPFREGKKHV